MSDLPMSSPPELGADVRGAGLVAAWRRGGDSNPRYRL
jgi:hypothetical protein